MSKIVNLIQKRGLKTTYKIEFMKAFPDLLLKPVSRKLMEFTDVNRSISLNFNLRELFTDISFLFSFNVTSIDKSKKKNTRNKSNSYFFLWKYLPIYKRRLFFLKTLIKDLKFVNLTRFKEKITSLFLNFALNKTTYISKFIFFINSYVFKNLNVKLFKNYLTAK